MFLSLTVYGNTQDKPFKIASRTDETIRALKDRICHKLNLNPIGLDLRTLYEGRDLNTDDMLVGQLGINDSTFIVASEGKRIEQPKPRSSIFAQQEEAMKSFTSPNHSYPGPIGAHQNSYP